MKTKQSRIASETFPRSTRSRPTPQWLLTSTELDQIAQRRCVKLLSVLSGETSVTEAIAEMQISRGTYYKLETTALAAMLTALTPGVEGASSTDGTASLIWSSNGSWSSAAYSTIAQRVPTLPTPTTLTASSTSV